MEQALRDTQSIAWTGMIVDTADQRSDTKTKAVLIPVKGAVLDSVILPHCLSELDCFCLVFLYIPKTADAKPVTYDENLACFL